MLTDADRDIVDDLIDITEMRGDSELPLESLYLCTRPNCTPSAQEAEQLLKLVSEFAHARAEDPSAKDDPDRVDYTDLIAHLTAIKNRS